MRFRIKRQDFGQFLKLLKERGSIISIGRNFRKDDIIPASDGEILQVNSLRDILLPVEQIVKIPENLSNEKILVFGAKPCDLSALELLDKVFLLEGREDPFYANRRNHLVIFGSVCGEKEENCFCDLVGVNMRSSKGMDVVVQTHEDSFIFDVITTEGEEFISLLNVGFELSSEREVAGDENLKFQEKLPSVFAGKMENMKNDPVWEKFSLTCLECGICTLNCPACWCFDIRDVDGWVCRQFNISVEDETRDNFRIRCPDSCQLPYYSVMAGGADPLREPGDKFMHRILHKFCYIPERYGCIGCCGCGRCLRMCPQGIDLREIIEIAKQK